MHANRSNFADSLKCLVAISAVVILQKQLQAQVARSIGSVGIENYDVERFQRELDQIQEDTTLRANPQIPLTRRLLIDYGAYATVSYLSVDDPYRNNHGLRQYDLVGYGHLNLDGAQEVYLRGKMSWLDFNPGDSFDGHGDQTHIDIDRASYRFDLQKAVQAYQGKQIDCDISFLGGRQLAYWGNGLTLVQTIDGAVIDLNYQKVDLQILAGITPANTIDFDTNRPDYDSNTHRGFYGAMLSVKLVEQRPFVYGLWQLDFNHDYVFDTPVEGMKIPTHFRYNSYYIGTGISGPLSDRVLYGLEGVYEGGRDLSNSYEAENSSNGATLIPVTQTDDTIQACAFDGHVDYVFNDSRRTRLTGELTYATGDHDRLLTNSSLGGNRTGSRDHAFNGFGLINTGLAFSPVVSNIYVLRLGTSCYPVPQAALFRHLQAGADLFFYEKAEHHAPIDQSTGDVGYLGTEPDVFVNWQIASDVTLATRYGIFVPKQGAFPLSGARQFFYSGITFAF